MSFECGGVEWGKEKSTQKTQKRKQQKNKKIYVLNTESMLDIFREKHEQGD